MYPDRPAPKVPDLPGQWTIGELALIDYLATGYALTAAARRVGVTYDTAKQMSAKPGFREAVLERAAQFLKSRDSIHQQSVTLATLLFHQGLTGELSADDPTLALAIRLLRETDWAQRRLQA